MTDKDTESLIDGHGTNKVLDLLENLKDSSAGNILYQQVEHVMRDADHAQDRIVRGYAAIAQLLISAYRKSLPENTLLFLELQLVQKRLNPPVTLAELATIHAYLRNATRLIKKVARLDGDAFNDVLSPFLSKRNIHGKADDVDEAPPGDETADIGNSRLQSVFDEDSGTFRYIEQSIDSVYRSKLNQHHKEIMKVQANLADKVGAMMRQQETFAERLESALTTLEHASKEKRPEQLRHSLVHEIETILTEQGNLIQIMHDTQSFLQLIGSNIRKLSDELDQVRVLSLTDELTQLPNRRAFLRRIKDETDRAQRDETLLTVAMIDLDHFKNINDKYGHAVGDEILRVYSRDVLSIFRRYDMVARYGGEEFAVILPNTDMAGSGHAFKKIQNKVAETVIINNNRVLQIPTFSAGLAIYLPGESVESLIERADDALYKAKQAGRNCIEYDRKFTGEPEQTEEQAH